MVESSEMRRSYAYVKGLSMNDEVSLPDLSRLSLDKKLEVEGQRKQVETDGDMVFSTAGTSARDPRHNLQMASQSSISGLEENKSARGGNLSGRDQLDPRMMPSEYPPHELGRPSLSESTGAPSKNFSPQFDKISSHTKNNQPRISGEENLLSDDDTGQPACTSFPNSENATFHGGGTGRKKSRQEVDGVFQVSAHDVDSSVNDGSLANYGDSDDDDELTYNS